MMSPPEEPTLSEDIRQRKNKNMEDISMKTFVRSTALTLVAFALALMLSNTASAACEGLAWPHGFGSKAEYQLPA